MKRVQLSRKKGYVKPADAVVVTRPGPFGNPFQVGKYKHRWMIYFEGDTTLRAFPTKQQAIEKSVELHRAWLHHPDQLGVRQHAYRALRGRDLACWCHPETPCHADNLIDLFQAAYA